MEIEGGTTKDPIILYYRDGLDVFKFLFGNPLFQGHQGCIPMRIWEDDSCKVQFFGEPMSGDYVYEIQVRLVYSSLILEQTMFALAGQGR